MPTEAFQASLTDDQFNELVQPTEIFYLHHAMYAHDMHWWHQIYFLGAPENPEVNRYREAVKSREWHQLSLLSAPKYPRLSSEHHIHKYYCDLIDILRLQVQRHYDVRFAGLEWEFEVYECRRHRDRGFIFKHVYEPSQQQTYWETRWCVNFICDRFLRPYSFIKAALSVVDGEIVPSIEEITSKREIKKVVGKYRFTVKSTMIKLSNLLFGIIDEFESVDEFQSAQQCEVQNKAVAKLIARNWKYIGNCPDFRGDDMAKYGRTLRDILKEKEKRKRNEECLCSSCLMQ